MGAKAVKRELVPDSFLGPTMHPDEEAILRRTQQISSKQGEGSLPSRLIAEALIPLVVGLSTGNLFSRGALGAAGVLPDMDIEAHALMGTPGISRPFVELGQTAGSFLTPGLRESLPVIRGLKLPKFNIGNAPSQAKEAKEAAEKAVNNQKAIENALKDFTDEDLAKILGALLGGKPK